MARVKAPEMVASFGRSASEDRFYGLPGTAGFFPVNNPGFDPLGFTKGKSKDEVYRLREVRSRDRSTRCSGWVTSHARSSRA